MLLLPGIDKADAETLEVAHVACGERRLAGTRDAGDLKVADLHATPGSLPCGRDRAVGVGVGVGGRTVKELHAAVEILG